MRVMIITVAGQSARFNQHACSPALKCIYHEDGLEHSILYRLLMQGMDYDKIILVGGFLFDQLKDALEAFALPTGKLKLIYNRYYQDRGSMYSLYLGLLAAEAYNPEEVLFAEGDLVVDTESFGRIARCSMDAVSISNAIIRADQSVVLYVGTDERLHYLYDTAHAALAFPQPVKSVMSSAQIWKFYTPSTLFSLSGNLTEWERCQTNLTLIDAYFSRLSAKQVQVIPMKFWLNCNTRQDYRVARESGYV